MKIALLTLVAGTLLLPVTALPGQPDPAGEPTPVPVQQPKPKKKAKPSFPKLTTGQKALVARLLKQLANRNPEKSEPAAKALVKLGPGILPQVLGRLADGIPARTPNLERVAGAVVRPGHAPALAPYLGNHRKVVRLVTTRLLVQAPNRKVLPAVEKAFAKEREAPIRVALAYCLCHLASTKGLPTLYQEALKDFMKKRDRILAAAKPLKANPAAARWLDLRLGAPSFKEKLAALRLLAMAGDHTSARAMAPFLNARNHKLASETINALRSIVDGKPPLKHISVFNMIGLRKRWKVRVAGI